jgi:hypothetical protein
MKFDFDYNQYDPQLTYSTVQLTNAATSESISYVNDTVQLSVSANGAFPSFNIPQGASYAQISSSAGVDWASGHETHFMFTVEINLSNFSSSVLSGAYTAQTRFGIFDATDGLGLVQTITYLSPASTLSFKFFIRNNGTETLTAINGTAPASTISQPAVNVTSATNLYLYRVVVSDKLTGPITIEFYNGATNTWTVIHQLTNNANTLSLPQLRTLKLPLCVNASLNFPSSNTQIYTGTLQVNTSGWHLMTVGDAFRGATRSFSTFSSAVAASATESHVLTIQNAGISGAKTNHVAANIKNFGPWANRLGRFKIYRNATVTGTSFSNIDVNNSIMQSTTTGTYTIGTGIPVFATTYDPISGDATPFDYIKNSIAMYPGDTLTITSLLPFDTAGQAFATIAWDELF